MPPIALLTDFGLLDPYVGQMKAAVLTLAPEARIVDLCHGVEPFNVLQAAFYLEASRPFFPEGTVFVAVVDPGVGTSRGIILAEAEGRRFLAPDNGLLTLLLDGADCRVHDMSAHAEAAASSTFHGRDVFAPLAAHLALGEDPARLGPEIDPTSLIRLPWAKPRQEAGVVEAIVLHVDRFGNAVLNLPDRAWSPRLAKAQALALDQPERLPLILGAAYADLPEGALGIHAGSQGFLELAMNRRSAAARLGLAPGDPVRLLVEPETAKAKAKGRGE